MKWFKGQHIIKVSKKEKEAIDKLRTGNYHLRGNPKRKKVNDIPSN